MHTCIPHLIRYTQVTEWTNQHKRLACKASEEHICKTVSWRVRGVCPKSVCRLTWLACQHDQLYCFAFQITPISITLCARDQTFLRRENSMTDIMDSTFVDYYLRISLHALVCQVFSTAWIEIHASYHSYRCASDCNADQGVALTRIYCKIRTPLWIWDNTNPR